MRDVQIETESVAQAAGRSDAGAGRGCSRAAIALLRGIVSREDDEAVWQEMLQQRAQLADYFAVLGLRVEINEYDEYACLRQREGSSLPPLMARYQLGFGVSLLLVELRRLLEEHARLQADAGGTGRLRVTVQDMAERLAPFFPPPGNEQRFRQQVERYMSQAVSLGFLRRPRRGEADAYEVQPVLRSFVDAQWLGELDAHLAAYVEYARTGGAAVAPAAVEDDGLFAGETEAAGADSPAPAAADDASAAAEAREPEAEGRGD